MNPQAPYERSNEAVIPAWNPVAVRDLLRQAELEGRHPSRLLLGRRETLAFHDHLATAFGEEGRVSVRDNYYLGLEVVELDVASVLKVSGDKRRRAWEGHLAPLWKEPPPHAVS